jgi:hypothetical protein
MPGPAFLRKFETDNEPGLTDAQLMLTNHDLKPGGFQFYFDHSRWPTSNSTPKNISIGDLRCSGSYIPGGDGDIYFLRGHLMSRTSLA